MFTLPGDPGPDAAARDRRRDLPLANAAPARMLCRIINVGRNAVDDVAWAEPRAEFFVLRILRVVGFLHRIEVVQDPVELVKSVDCGQVFVAIPQVVLADLRRRVAERLEDFRDRWIGILKPCFPAGRATFSIPVRNGVCPVMNAAHPAVQDCCP